MTEQELTQLPEAPASANARLNSPSGVAWQFTLRDFSAKALIKKCQIMESHLLNNGWSVSGPTSPSAPTNGANGDAAPVCEFHGAMKRSKHNDGWFCPKKMGDGTYCKSKA